ncbi:hypothetical protein LTR16_000005 [Cryomyces antarcticus]|uniref:Acid phosphatase n=1 Tax=Cryomyces antarcticus TaxID=329879 RepID=A0ABR0KUX7_9PEZI|nr:hypothetical protein LTR39_000022 [Cryomyces antarcticus]KAK5021386.1 hypothetical protein LTR60_000001 [Cryomyces antarcticus]KAK5132126.1 hypothetical protein LTR16_000005 [Cryomyces antarcticus]
MRFSHLTSSLFVSFSYATLSRTQNNTNTVDLSWHPPVSSNINNLSTVINGSDIYGFIFSSSQNPAGVPYGTYNWCNMPHVRASEYPRVNSSFKLEYVEVIHRHHKRTPYAANTFPVEPYPWYCDDEGLFYGGKPLNPLGNGPARTYWNVYTSHSNPLAPKGLNGTCQFPQITRGGLDDSHQHGVDLFGVYHELLNFIPADYNAATVSFRVTNNVITSQVASMLIAGMYPQTADHGIRLLLQQASIDSLEPAYTCEAATALSASYGAGSTFPAWLAHLNASASLYATFDALSGIPSNASDWHMSWDHYFDNLSARLCHGHPLPCSTTNSSNCVTLAEAEEVFRLGQYEYSFLYRDADRSLPAATASYGIWIAELAQNLRHAMGHGASTVNATADRVKYRHNVAHDGSISRLLSILQVETMVWPGMGAEIVFELYSANSTAERGSSASATTSNSNGYTGNGSSGSITQFFIRVFWSGRVLRSSSAVFGVLDMVPAERVLAYFDGLVGVGASRIPGLCG